MSEYLSEEEQVARLKSWWDENGTFVMVVTVLAVAAIVGWRWYDGYATDRAHAASKLFDEYRVAEGDARKAAAAAIEADYAGSAYHVFVLFTQAQEALAAEDLTLADIALSHAVEVSSDPLLVDLARIRLAKVQYGLDRADDALATLGAVRTEGYQAWALETQGDIYAAQDELEAAHESYSAAIAMLQPGDERPLLTMKLDNLAPFDGSFVEFSDPLDDALRQALEQVEAGLPALDGIDASADVVESSEPQAAGAVEDAVAVEESAQKAVEEAVEEAEQAIEVEEVVDGVDSQQDGG